MRSECHVSAKSAEENSLGWTVENCPYLTIFDLQKQQFHVVLVYKQKLERGGALFPQEKKRGKAISQDGYDLTMRMTDKSLEEGFYLEQSLWGEIVAEKLGRRDIHFIAGQGVGGSV